MDIKKRLRQLFSRKKKTVETKAEPVVICKPVDHVAELEAKWQREHQERQEHIDQLTEDIAERQRRIDALKSSRQLGRNIAKEMKIERIRAKNLERRRGTMGYGLSSKFFKPRPAYEKKNWRLDQKPED